MKTLDEVIKAFEICIGYYCSNAEHDVCPYFGESDMGCGKEPEKDALHYLKEFQGLSKMWNDKLDKEKANPPLTWDELRTMEGKPVYVRLLGAYESYPNASRWMLVQSDVSFGNVWFIDRSRARYCFYEKDMNDIWQAYRKERNENAG